MVEGLAAVEFDIRGRTRRSKSWRDNVSDSRRQSGLEGRGQSASGGPLPAGNDAAAHRRRPGRLSEHGVQFEPLAQLAPNAEVTFRIRAKAIQPGDLRIKAQLLVDDMRQPVTKERKHAVYVDSMSKAVETARGGWYNREK